MFREAFLHEMEKLAIPGRSLNRLLKADPESAPHGKRFADVLRAGRKPLTTIDDKGVSHREGSPELMRVILAGMRGGASAGLRHKGTEAVGKRAEKAGENLSFTQAMRERHRLSRLVGSGKITMAEADRRDRAARALSESGEITNRLKSSLGA